jgi:hypothetical protein
MFVLLYFFFCSLHCLSFWLPLWYLLITTMVSSDYHFGIFWLPLWYLLITTLVSSDYHYGIFWLPLWYLLITTLVSSDYHFGIFWLPLWYLLITTMVSSNIFTRILPSLSTIRGVHVTQSMFSVLWNIAQNIVFVHFFGHLMNWLTLWNLQTICVQYTNFTTDAMHQAEESYYLGAPGLTPVLSGILLWLLFLLCFSGAVLSMWTIMFL